MPPPLLPPPPLLLLLPPPPLTLPRPLLTLPSPLTLLPRTLLPRPALGPAVAWLPPHPSTSSHDTVEVGRGRCAGVKPRELPSVRNPTLPRGPEGGVAGRPPSCCGERGTEAPAKCPPSLLT